MFHAILCLLFIQLKHIYKMKAVIIAMVCRKMALIKKAVYRLLGTSDVT